MKGMGEAADLNDPEEGGCCSNYGCANWLCHILTNWLQVISCFFLVILLYNAKKENFLEFCMLVGSFCFVCGVTAIIAFVQTPDWCESEGFKDYRTAPEALPYRQQDIFLDWIFAAWVAWCLGTLSLEDKEMKLKTIITVIGFGQVFIDVVVMKGWGTAAPFKPDARTQDDEDEDAAEE